MLHSSTQTHTNNWPLYIPALLSAYYMIRYATTGITPNTMMLGQEVLPLCTLTTSPSDDFCPEVPFISELRHELRSTHHQVRESLRANARTERQGSQNV